MTASFPMLHVDKIFEKAGLCGEGVHSTDSDGAPLLSQQWKAKLVLEACQMVQNKHEEIFQDFIDHCHTLGKDESVH